MFNTLCKNLEKLGYGVSCFKTAKEAVKYLDEQIDSRSVGFGGSVTLDQIGLYPALSTHNDVFWHQNAVTRDESIKLREKATTAEIYISSVNAIAETGEIINIDGNCNRVAATMYGHEKVYLVVGKNKLAPDRDSALWRARNIAAPLNAKRLNKKTPCAVSGKCHDCNSPERICRALTVFWSKPLYHEIEVVLIEEELGY